MNQAIADIQADVATLTDALAAEKTKVDTLISLVEKAQTPTGLNDDDVAALASIKASIEAATQGVKDESSAVDAENTKLGADAGASTGATTEDPGTAQS